MAPGLASDRALNQWTALLCFAIILVGPMLMSDCVSREARDGTLGLLFLTPLTPVGIVMAKSLVQALRAVGLVWE